MTSTGVERHLRLDGRSPLPLRDQLADQLMWLMARGEIAAGSHLPPVRALAARLGINFNTVRAAYKRLEAEGLVLAERGRGTLVLPYRPGPARRGARGVRSFTIGVIIPAHGPFYVPFLNAIETACTDPSLFFVCNAREDQTEAMRYLDQLSAKGVDGIIVIGSMIRVGFDPRELGRIPIVFADDPGAGGPRVLFDHKGGSLAATSHLLDHGYRSLGFVAPPLEKANIRPKYEGFLQGLGRLGPPRSSELVAVATGFSVEAGAIAAGALLDLPRPPTAIVAATDNLAIGVMRAARARNIQVPGDLGVVGNDNMVGVDLLEPALTTVDAPVAEMGVRAMTLLQRLIAGAPAPTRPVRLTAKLVIRESCGCVH